MKKSMRITQAAMLACALSASAAAGATPVIGNFSFAPLCVEVTGECISYVGKFVGNDLDEDGVLEQSELRYVRVGRTTFYKVEHFSYTIGGALELESVEDAPDLKIWEHFKTGEGLTVQNGPSDSDTFFAWNKNTVSSVVLSPVPEPASGTLLVTGLAAALFLRRKARPAQS